MPTMSYNEIIDTAMAALRDDEAIQEWCERNYGKRLAVYNDIDPVNPPTENDCPLVFISPLGGEMGQDRSVFLRGFFMQTCVSDDTADETADENGRVTWKKYHGTERVSYLHESLVYPALCKAFNSKGFPVSTTDEESEVMNNTLFTLKAGVTVEMERAIGEDVPLLG